MKAPYEELELEVIRFKTEDIITTSDALPDQDDQGGNEEEQTPETSGKETTDIFHYYSTDNTGEAASETHTLTLIGVDETSGESFYKDENGNAWLYVPGEGYYYPG